MSKSLFVSTPHRFGKLGRVFQPYRIQQLALEIFTLLGGVHFLDLLYDTYGTGYHVDCAIFEEILLISMTVPVIIDLI
jgi:hypothetical protein